MENIPVPPYPGPPLEPISSIQQRTFTQPAAQTHHITAEARPYNHQSPGSQHHRSLPMENIPVPPYPGPPLESQSICSVQQRTFTHHSVSQTYHTTAEHSYGHQPLRSLPMENIPVPPYPGPPLDSQSISSVQNRTFTHQPAPQTYHIPSEGGPGTNLHFPGSKCQSPADMEKINPSMFYEPPLKVKSQGCMQEKVFAHQDTAHKHYTPVQSHSSSEKKTIEISRQTKSTDSAPTALYSSSALNLQTPRQTVQYIIPGASASMYSYYGAGVVQPGVQVVQTGGTQVVIQPQRQTVVVPSMASPTVIQPVAAQPAVVIQPATPAVRVIQPQVLPTVIQPAASTVVYRRYY